MNLSLWPQSRLVELWKQIWLTQPSPPAPEMGWCRCGCRTPAVSPLVSRYRWLTAPRTFSPFWPRCSRWVRSKPNCPRLMWRCKRWTTVGQHSVPWHCTMRWRSWLTHVMSPERYRQWTLPMDHKEANRASLGLRVYQEQARHTVRRVGDLTFGVPLASGVRKKWPYN